MEALNAVSDLIVTAVVFIKPYVPIIVMFGVFGLITKLINWL